MSASSSNVAIRDVNSENLEEEFQLMLDLIDDFPVCSMDTEFPGIVLEPYPQDGNPVSVWNYAQLRDNVNALKLIQLGITLASETGEIGGCWQFNFEFDLAKDMYASDAIELLKNAGLDFSVNQLKGISPEVFGEILMSSGLVLNENVRWVSFHGLYDFGYVLKVLTSAPLPESIDGFFEALDLFFPKRCDIKYLTRNDGRHGGLNQMAAQVGCTRNGASHQGGSDSLLTNDLFWALDLLHSAFNEENDVCGGLYSLSNESSGQYQPFYQAKLRHNSPFQTPSREMRPKSNITFKHPRQVVLEQNIAGSPPMNSPPMTVREHMHEQHMDHGVIVHDQHVMDHMTHTPPNMSPPMSQQYDQAMMNGMYDPSMMYMDYRGGNGQPEVAPHEMVQMQYWYPIINQTDLVF